MREIAVTNQRRDEDGNDDDEDNDKVLLNHCHDRETIRRCCPSPHANASGHRHERISAAQLDIDTVCSISISSFNVTDTKQRNDRFPLLVYILQAADNQPRSYDADLVALVFNLAFRLALKTDYFYALSPLLSLTLLECNGRVYVVALRTYLLGLARVRLKNFFCLYFRHEQLSTVARKGWTLLRILATIKK